jgi:hypothetical protein
LKITLQQAAGDALAIAVQRLEFYHLCFAVVFLLVNLHFTVFKNQWTNAH